MRNILFAWELGSGLGHLNRLIAVARHFETTSNVFFAIPSFSNTEAFVRASFERNIFIIRMRSHTAAVTKASREAATDTLADVLQILGFADASRLGSYFDDWQLVLQACKPALIVADFAPMLRLTTDGSIPLIVVGNGYTIPPPGRPLPPLRPWQTEVSRDSASREDEITRQLNQLRRSKNMSELPFLADLFAGDMTFPCTLPLFDPYRHYRTSEPARPFNTPHIECGSTERHDAGAGIFVYLPSSHPVLANLLEALRAARFQAKAYLSGPAARIQDSAGDNIVFLKEAADLSVTLPKARLLIHHGGLGTAYAGLLAGTPQLVLPVNLEHLITSKALLEIGVAQGFSANTRPGTDQLSTAINAMMTNRAWLNKACAAARTLPPRDDLGSLQDIIGHCRTCLTSSGAGLSATDSS